MGVVCIQQPWLKFKMPVIKEMDVDEAEKQAQLFAKQMLQSRLFIGSFQEKRYVENLQSYRDVVVVSHEETDLIRDLEIVKNRMRKFYGENCWVGLTGPNTIGAPAGHCLWVELPDELFGSYWYKISKIKFRPNEVLLKLKVIRPTSSASSSSSSSRIIHKSHGCDDGNRSGFALDESEAQPSFQNLNKSFIAARNAAIKNFCLFCSTVFTIKNTTEALKFISLLLVATVTGAVQFIEYLGNFSIKLMRELTLFLRASTPIVIACINLVGKAIGGFYLLILSMWRDRKGPSPVYRSPYVGQQMITDGRNFYNYDTVYFKRNAPRLRNKNGAVITPLD